MTGGSPIARFAMAVRARYARSPGRRPPFAGIVRRAPTPAAAVALHRHLHVAVTAPAHVVHRTIGRQLGATPARGDVRPPAARMLVVERLLTRRERVERAIPREVVRHAPRLAHTSPPPAPPGTGPSSPSAAMRPLAPAPVAPPSPATPDVERLTADVIRAIDRRIIAQRERLGRV